MRTEGTNLEYKDCDFKWFHKPIFPLNICYLVNLILLPKGKPLNSKGKEKSFIGKVVQANPKDRREYDKFYGS